MNTKKSTHTNSNLAQLNQRYIDAAHAMQTGVALKMATDSHETQPKHLRVGVNSAMVETSAIVSLLIRKGIISEEEWMTELVKAMEAERDRYADYVHKTVGENVKIK